MMLRHNRSVSHVCQSTDGEPRGCSCLYVTASCCSPTSLSSARSSHSRSLSNDDCNSFHRRLFSSTLSYIGVKRVLKDARDYTRTQQHCHHHHHYHHRCKMFSRLKDYRCVIVSVRGNKMSCRRG